MLHAVRIGLGAVLMLAGIGSVAAYGMPGVIVGVSLGMAAALCLYPYLSSLAADLLIAPFRAMVGKDSLALRKDYSGIHAAMARHDFEHALAQIEAVLQETPHEQEAQLLRVRIAYEELDRIEYGLTCAFAALESLEWNDTQGKIVMLAVDMLLYSQLQADAANLLAQAGQRLVNRIQRDDVLSRLSNLRA
jgi:hypothetical protein